MLTSGQERILRALRMSLGSCAAAPDGAEAITQAEAEEIAGAVWRNGILLTVYDALPEAAQALLRDRYFASMRQMMLQEHAHGQITAALAAAGYDIVD